ncbi:hypothetical protein JXL21_02500 [Candidatus Bathyarchaeota archaeon]|nr:hypothetical protein [Candidatus Bathyarchaeota archaeon]
MVEGVYRAEVQIRRAGETRYGKGEIEITSDVVYMRWKKFLGKQEEAYFDRSRIESVKYMSRGLPIEMYGPGIPTDQSWLTLEIQLDGGEGYTIYVGQPQNAAPEGYFETFETIYGILNGDEAPEAESRVAVNGSIDLRCPRCGAVEEHTWICPNCQADQPYYSGGVAVNFCYECGWDRRQLFPDPELICMGCGEYSRASQFTPV